MDCCNTKQNTKKENREESMKGNQGFPINRSNEQMKGGKSMANNKRIVLWAVIGLLFLSVLFLTYKASSATGNVVAGDSGQLDTSGWSENEKMNYEMHGTVPARLQGKVAASTASSGTGMVGGC